jgi:RNA polymerase sigma-70 factor, ECF subfamily
METNVRDFEEFYRRHHAALVRQARRQQRTTRLGADAEDLVQETFERAFQAFSRFQPGSNGLAWLRTILNRLFIDHCRRPHRRHDVEISELVPAPSAPEPEVWWLSLTMGDIKEAAAALPEQSRMIFESAVAGCSYAQIAARTGLCTSTVGSRLNRIRRRLRSRLMRRRPGERSEPETPSTSTVRRQGRSSRRPCRRRRHGGSNP